VRESAAPHLLRIAFAAAVAWGCCTEPATAEDPPPGIAPCVSCHGPLGTPTDSSVPIIAGQNRDYLLQALRAYSNGGRTGGMADVMAGYAKGLAESELPAIADFYSKLKPVR